MTSPHTNFQDLCTTFRPRIINYLKAIVGADNAEDLAQVTLTRIEKGLPGFEQRSELTTWIYRIARNTAIDWLRREASRCGAGMESLSADLPAAGSTEQPERTPEEHCLDSEMGRCIRSMVGILPPADKEIIHLKDIAGFKNSEIAEKLGLDLGVVKSRLHRARARLRQAFTENCDLYRDGRNELGCTPKGGR